MADAITTHAASRRQLQAGKDAQAEASWRERALNGEDALNGRYRTTSRAAHRWAPAATRRVTQDPEPILVTGQRLCRNEDTCVFGSLP